MVRIRIQWYSSVIMALLGVGCLTNTVQPTDPESNTLLSASSLELQRSDGIVENTLAQESIDASDILISIQDIQQLQMLEREYSFAHLLPSLDVSIVGDRVSTQWLFQHHLGYRQLVAHLQDRIDQIAQEIDRDLIIELKDALQYPAGNVGRRLDNRWFDSDIAFFELVGVVNRLDKKDFYGGCGEVRLIYRLAYQSKDGSSSRLPVTLNLVMENSATDCRAIAQQWLLKEFMEDPNEMSQWLKNNPLNLEQLRFKQLEINAQIVRFPSGLETEFAGQAIYLLKVYGFEKAHERIRLIEVPLENTPDVIKIQQDPSLQQELIDWINNHSAEIDNGTYLIPERFLATEALSYSTLGIHRSANKPFDLIFTDAFSEKIADPQGELQWINSKRAMIDRLNNGSCIGCHQASTTAGFHFLGEDNPEISGVTNRLALPFSAHFHREIARRQQQLKSLIQQEKEHTFRPHSLAPAVSVVARNHTCILTEHAQDFQPDKRWSCSEGEICQKVVQSDVALSFGQCMPSKEELLSGNTCRMGEVQESDRQSQTGFNLHAYADQFIQQQVYDLPDNKAFVVDSYNCRPTRIGVPLGRTYRKCSQSERSFEPQQSDRFNPEICAVVGGAQFDSCVEKDFHKCLDSIVARGMVDSCHVGKFCREDYICQALPYQLNGVDTDKGKAIAEAGVGFCTPTYFVFQLRLDGHPIP